MDKKRVVMVDYWSVCDSKGKPVGHGGKVANEYYEYIKEQYDVTQYVNKSMLPYLNNSKKKGFRHSLNCKSNKIERVIRHFQCLKEVYKKEKRDTIWFYVPDIYLFLFIFLNKKGKRCIFVNVYEEFLGNRIKRFIFLQALKKIDGVFVTNKNLLKTIPNGILIPDYAYNEEVYEKYRIEKKKEQVVCLGTMNEKKQLMEAVEVFSKNGYPLYIIGQFESEEKYKYLCEIKATNVIIENRYVDVDEYYKLLAESMFCLIPYDPEFYKNRTSGVIQECLFVDTIPISHRQILDFNNIEGIGYNFIEEIHTNVFDDVDIKALQKSYLKEKNNFYKYTVIQEKIIDSFHMK